MLAQRVFGALGEADLLDRTAAGRARRRCLASDVARRRGRSRRVGPGRLPNGAIRFANGPEPRRRRGGVRDPRGRRRRGGACARRRRCSRHHAARGRRVVPLPPIDRTGRHPRMGGASARLRSVRRHRRRPARKSSPRGTGGWYSTAFAKSRPRGGAAGVNVATSAVLSGRLPMLAIAGLVAVALVVSPTPARSAGIKLADVASLATVTPAFAGVAQGMHASTRAERWAAVVARVLRGSPDPRSGSTRPMRPPHRPPGDALVRSASRFGTPAPPRRTTWLHDVSFTWAPERLRSRGRTGRGKARACAF